MTEVLVLLVVFCINMFSGALLLTVVFKLFDDTLRGEYLKEAFLASLRYTAIVNGAAFLVYVIGMLVVSPALTLCLGLALSIGSMVLMAKMFALGLKELFVISFLMWLVGYGIIGIIMLAATAFGLPA
jgi:hypothetical protein|tara:strand:+ start:848 stop:1231 length:384 start_codon:yes stop_codon:yes gene_type:complete